VPEQEIEAKGNDTRMDGDQLSGIGWRLRLQILQANSKE